jgi:XTP/dITP diphosphohydrolase
VELLIGTQNSGKMREFQKLLAPLAAPILFPPDLGIEIDVKEKGETYAENAELKARAYAAAARDRQSAPSLVTLADDSGLEVDALDGAPGIRSARYALGSDVDRLTQLLAHLEGVPPERRTARFRCVIAIVTPEGALQTAEGACEGVIAPAPAGSGGFGYDPVFYLPEYDRTMAQLPPEVKNRISHRARAAQAALPVLRQLDRPQTSEI